MLSEHRAPILTFTSKCSQQELDPNPAQTQWGLSPRAAACFGHRFVSRAACSPGALQCQVGGTLQVLLLNRWENGGLARCRDKTRARPLTEVNRKATRT